MSKSKYVIKKIEYEFEGDTYSAEIEFEIYREMYGQDADGNRGELRTYCEINEINNFEKNGKEIKEKNIPKKIMEYFENYDIGDVE